MDAPPPILTGIVNPTDFNAFLAVLPQEVDKLI